MNYAIPLDLITPDEPISDYQAAALDRITHYLTLAESRRTLWAESGQINAVSEGANPLCHYTYDDRGFLSQIEEPNGSITKFDYDDLGRLIQVIHADQSETTYQYSEHDRLVQVCDRDLVHQFVHDRQGRLTQARYGNAGTSVYRYNARGQVIEARNALVSTQQHWNEQGQLTQIEQTYDGVTLKLTSEFDQHQRLSRQWIVGQAHPIEYHWSEDGWLTQVNLGNTTLAQVQYDRDRKITEIQFANGLIEIMQADPIDCRPVQRNLCSSTQVLWQQIRTYNQAGQIFTEGEWQYTYDELERLSKASCLSNPQNWEYRYDDRDNYIAQNTPQHSTTLNYDVQNRLTEFRGNGTICPVVYDRFGRLHRIRTAQGERIYRYNDAHQLIQVLECGETIAEFIYDHKGRLVIARSHQTSERYFYGADDALLAVTDPVGNPLQLYVRTPLGLLAEIHPQTQKIYFCHHDDRGSRIHISDRTGQLIESFRYSPYGVPLENPAFQPLFTGHRWFAEVGLYYMGARWYDPTLGRFLTPDTYTGTPDDERIVNPLTPASKQLFSRAEILATWLKSPRVRNRYAYCNNDPINRVDPNGHWSFGGVLLSILGAIWTLPNTLFGLLIEITCLVGEVIRWIVWLITIGNVSWETPGFDVASSGRLNAFALVFEGGWLGSFSSLLGITFGNVFFVYKDWRNHPAIKNLPATVSPAAYNNTVSIPSSQALYEHELRHTNQYGWFGPFFHLGLPIWGVYVWDVILNGYQNAWLERDARDHGGL